MIDGMAWGLTSLWGGEGQSTSMKVELWKNDPSGTGHPVRPRR
jgi:hypothetical protein